VGGWSFFFVSQHGEAPADLARILSLLEGGDVQSALGIELDMDLDEDCMDVDGQSGARAVAAPFVGSTGSSSSSSVWAAAAEVCDPEAIGLRSITSIPLEATISNWVSTSGGCSLIRETGSAHHRRVGIPFRFLEEEATPTRGRPTRNRGCQLG
jgi:hypothetical protein